MLESASRLSVETKATLNCSSQWALPFAFGLSLMVLIGGPISGAAAGDNKAVSPVYTTMDELEWKPLDPANPDGPRIASLWGDPFSSGPYGALLRFPSGFASPMHTHSRDEKTITIKGTALHWTDSESPDDAKPMTAGAYTMIPGGVPHVSSCAPGGDECISFITQDGPFDFDVVPTGE